MAQTHTLDLRQAIEAPEIKRFETTMTERKGRPMTLRSTPLYEVIAVDAGLLETKISDLIMQGAYDEAGYWRDIAFLYPMTGEKQEVQLISPRNYVVRTGKVSRDHKEEAGGKIDRVELDVSGEQNDRYIHLKVDGRDIEMKRYLNIENSVKAAGAAFYKQVRDEILIKYLADKGVTQALGVDSRYAAIMKLASAMNKQGFGMNAIIIDSDDFVEAITEVVGNTLPWLTAMQAGASVTRDGMSASVGNLNGLVGYLGGRVPIYVVGSTSASLNGNILGVDKERGEVVGLHKDLTIKSSIDNLSSLQEAVLSMRYVISLGNANAIGAVTGA